ncbi:hypothetical protein M885DRAFT_562332 [Pelagophyceae sp. CCMP2097]|nr:hypothetical protein M885DRAFT_562332 [Pelagophyceae sp. CCMP2097]
MADADDGFLEKRASPARTEAVIGRDQQGRAVYADKSFVPQEEQEAYRPGARAAAPQKYAPGDIPGANADVAQPGDARGADVVGKNAKKNEARRLAKQRFVDAAGDAAAAPAVSDDAAAPEAADDLRRAKALKKKMKAVDELRTKVDAGLAPSAEQLEKLDRAAALNVELLEIEEQIRRL